MLSYLRADFWHDVSDEDIYCPFLRDIPYIATDEGDGRTRRNKERIPEMKLKLIAVAALAALTAAAMPTKSAGVAQEANCRLAER